MSENTNLVCQVEVEEIKGLSITKDFLQVVTQREIASFRVCNGSNPGDNYCSILTSVEVTFKDDQKEYYLIKCCPSNCGSRDLAEYYAVFKREIFLYRELFPTLFKMAGDCSKDSSLLSSPLAPFHGGNVANTSTNFNGTLWENDNFLVMTDLRKYHFKMVDRKKGLDVEHTILVLKELAKLHAFAWAHKEKNGIKSLPKEYPELAFDNKGHQKNKDAWLGHVHRLLESMQKATAEVLGDHPAVNALSQFMEKDIFTLDEFFMSHQGKNENDVESFLRVKPDIDEGYSAEPWMTLLHGDCWLNKLLFRYENSSPAQVVFVDFQVSKEGCPTVDLAYFLYSSVQSAIRIPSKDMFLQTHYDAFVGYCQTLRVNPFPGFSLEALKRRFRRAELFAIIGAVPLLNLVLKEPEHTVDWERSKSEGKDEDKEERISCVLRGSETNSKLKAETAVTILNLYETGVI